MARMCTKFLKRRWSQSVKTARCATSFWTGNNDVQNARGVFTSDQGHRHHGDDGAHTDAQLRTLPPLPAPSPGVDKQVEALVAAWDHPPQSQKILGIQTLES